MKPSTLLATVAARTLAPGLSCATAAQAQEADKLPSYGPVLPPIKARALAVDPQKGDLVQQVKPDMFVITDGIYQSAFVTTGKGVFRRAALICARWDD